MDFRPPTSTLVGWNDCCWPCTPSDRPVRFCPGRPARLRQAGGDQWLREGHRGRGPLLLQRVPGACDHRVADALHRWQEGDRLGDGPGPQGPARSDYAYFSWIAAHNSTTSGGDRSFDLFIEDQKALTFTTHHSTKPATWSADGVDGVKLVFEFSKTGSPRRCAWLRASAGAVEIHQAWPDRCG